MRTHSGVALDLELVADPALVFRMSDRDFANLRGSTREIAALIVELPWVSTNMGVLGAALFAFGVPGAFRIGRFWFVPRAVIVGMRIARAGKAPTNKETAPDEGAASVLQTAEGIGDHDKR